MKTEPVGAGEMLQMVMGLMFVIAIILGVAWFIRRMGTFQQMSHGALKILGGLSIGQRERVVLIQVGDKQLLVGVAPGQIRTLHVLDSALKVNTNQKADNTSFSEKLQSVIQSKLK